MTKNVNLHNNIFWIGVNDRQTQLFESLWPLPRGVAYNSYVIVDKKIAVLDTVKFAMHDEYLAKLESVLEGRNIDYLIINHMEPDHSGAITRIIEEFPKVKIVGNKFTFKILKGMFGISDNLLEVKEGDEIDLGKHKLQFYTTPMVHWPESMVTYDTGSKTLFSADIFGSFGTLNGGIFDDEVDIDYFEEELRRYYSNIVGKYSVQAQKALNKLGSLEIKQIAPTHGLIWRSKIETILNYYNDWTTYKAEDGVVIVFGSMYGFTERMTDIIARELTVRGIKNIRIYDVAKTHVSYIISDVWKFKGLILGAPTYNAGLFPAMDNLVNELKRKNAKNRILGLFGSYCWNGAALKNMNEFAESSGWKIIDGLFETTVYLTDEIVSKCETLAANMAEELGKM